MLITVINATLSFLLFVYIAYTVWRYPLVWRMAVRNLWLHRKTASLIVVGLTVATSLITMTLAMNASTRDSSSQFALEHFGRIAYEMPSEGQSWLTEPLLRAPDADKIGAEAGGYSEALSVVQLNSVVIHSSAGATLHMPDINLIGFERSKAIQFDPAMETLLPEIGPNEVVLTKRMALQLKARQGEQVELLDIDAVPVSFRIAGILPEEGLTGYKGIAYAQGTALISLDDARRLTHLPDDAFSGILLSSNSQLKSEWHIIPIRSDTMSNIDQMMSSIVTIFGVVGMIANVTSLLLIWNIYKLLIEERSKELGILRAIGLTGKYAALAIRAEGLLLASVSGVLGMLLGNVLAFGMCLYSREAISAGIKDMQMAYTFSLQFTISGFLIGVVATYICLWWLSRKTVTRTAIDALNDASDRVHSSKNVDRFKHLSFRAAVFFAFCNFLLVFVFVMSALKPMRNEFAVWMSHAMPLFILFLLGIVGLLVWIASKWMPLVLRGAKAWFEGQSRLYNTVTLAFRQLEQSPVRNGLLTLVFTLIVTMLCFSAVFVRTWENHFQTMFNGRQQLAGFDLTAFTQQQLTTADLQNMLKDSNSIDLNQIEVAASVQQLLIQTYRQNVYYTRELMVNGIDRNFADGVALPLLGFESRFPDERSVWREAADNPDVVIVSDVQIEASGEGIELGKTIPVQIGTHTVPKRVIAIAKEEQIWGYPVTFGVWIKQSELLKYTDHPEQLKSTLLFRLKDTASLDDAEASLRDALSLHRIYPLMNPAKTDEGFLRFSSMAFSSFGLFSGLSSVIGIVGVMVVFLRLVRSRRRQIGMLRALGMPGKNIFYSILIEGCVILAPGILIGTAIGIYGVYMMTDIMVQKGGEHYPVIIPYPTLACYVAASTAVILGCMWVPARNAASIAPAEATRYLD